MKDKTKLFIIMSLVAITWVFGFYGWYLPKHITDDKEKIEEYLDLNGLTPIEMVDVSGLSATSTWLVTKPDSLGNPVEKLVNVRLHKGRYILQSN